MGRNADPGRRARFLPRTCLGYRLTHLRGFQDEAAASLPLHCLKKRANFSAVSTKPLPPFVKEDLLPLNGGRTFS